MTFNFVCCEKPKYPQSQCFHHYFHFLLCACVHAFYRIHLLVRWRHSTAVTGLWNAAGAWKWDKWVCGCSALERTPQMSLICCCWCCVNWWDVIWSGHHRRSDVIEMTLNRSCLASVHHVRESFFIAPLVGVGNSRELSLSSHELITRLALLYQSMKNVTGKLCMTLLDTREMWSWAWITVHE